VPFASGQPLTLPSGWLGGGWRHVELSGSGLSIDGRRYQLGTGHGTGLSFTGRAQISALIISGAADRGALLLHRVAELHARISVGQFPVGADSADQIHLDSTYWTNGFWPGALWEAAALEPADGLFQRWALQVTLAHFGQEHADSHDVGFMYEQSSLAAWRALGCRRRPRAPCARLKASALAAADQLVALARSNPGAGTIPTNSQGTFADTIVDSMMNVLLLDWAGSVTGKPSYPRLASHHAHMVASLLVRADGSTSQSVHLDRATGKVLLIHTHQGLSNTSTWSRGEAWGVYGFAQSALELHDRGLLRVALRAAGYVARHLPSSAACAASSVAASAALASSGCGIPRWDYDAPAGDPVDVSAGVITATGLLHLAAACGSMPGVCGSTARYVALARRMLAAALTHASGVAPLGFLGDQVLNERGHGCWCNGGELSFGLTYALEGVRLTR
jgi:unsaturated chondroitin disaccharide hydrolase